MARKISVHEEGEAKKNQHQHGDPQIETYNSTAAEGSSSTYQYANISSTQKWYGAGESSSSHPPDIIDTKFGIEIETLITAPQQDGRTDDTIWANTVDPFSQDLWNAGVKVHFANAKEKKKEDFAEWYLTQDHSLEHDTKHQKWALELTSPIFSYADEQAWADQLGRVFGVSSNEPYYAAPSDLCATHVHVSMVKWTLDSVRKVAQAVVFYTGEFDTLASRYQRDTTTYASPNPGWVKEDVDGLIRRLGEYNNVKDIVNKINPSTNIKQRPHHYYWSLWRLVDPKVAHHHRTVEFRLPPGSHNQYEATMWIDLANIFVQAAVQYNGKWEEGTVNLYTFIWEQGSNLGIDQSRMATLYTLLHDLHLYE